MFLRVSEARATGNRRFFTREVLRAALVFALARESPAECVLHKKPVDDTLLNQWQNICEVQREPAVCEKIRFGENGTGSCAFVYASPKMEYDCAGVFFTSTSDATTLLGRERAVRAVAELREGAVVMMWDAAPGTGAGTHACAPKNRPLAQKSKRRFPMLPVAVGSGAGALLLLAGVSTWVARRRGFCSGSRCCGDREYEEHDEPMSAPRAALMSAPRNALMSARDDPDAFAARFSGYGDNSTPTASAPTLGRPQQPEPACAQMASSAAFYPGPPETEHAFYPGPLERTTFYPSPLEAQRNTFYPSPSEAQRTTFYPSPPEAQHAIMHPTFERYIELQKPF